VAKIVLDISMSLDGFISDVMHLHPRIHRRAK
jgi:hypothetical protein